MRFRATISQRKHGELQRLIQSLERTGHKECVLRLGAESENRATIALRADPSRPASSSEVWCHMQVDQWFDEYSISSLNDNQIILDLTLENLAAAFRAADKADKIAMRLAKNPVPCLDLEIRATAYNLNHIVPVDVWSAARSQATPLDEPAVEVPENLVWLPQLQKLCGLVDKMQKIDGTIYICADCGNNTLRFRVATDTTQFCAEFKVRMKTGEPCDEGDEEEDEEPLEVAVDIKVLARILHCYQVGSKHAVMGLLPTVVLMQITAGAADELQVSYVRCLPPRTCLCFLCFPDSRCIRCNYAFDTVVGGVPSTCQRSLLLECPENKFITCVCASTSEPDTILHAASLRCWR
jgi:hypothetical protein